MNLRTLRNLTCGLYAGTVAISCAGPAEVGDTADLSQLLRRGGDCKALETVEDEKVIAKGQCYRIDGDFELESATLTVEAGAVLEFAENASLRVGDSSKFLAIGSKDTPAVVRGESDDIGFWNSIEIAEGGEATFQFAEVTNGGGSEDDEEAGAIVVETKGSVDVTDSVFEFFGGFALDVDDGAAVTTFKRNKVEGSGDILRIAPGMVEMLDASCSFTVGGSDAAEQSQIVIGTGAVTAAVVWPALGVPYALQDDLVVEAGILKLSAGVELRFSEDAQLLVKKSAALSAQGTELSPVLMRGQEKQNGFWGGIVFDSERTANLLSFVEVIDAGQQASDPDDVSSAVQVTDGSQLRMDHTTISGSTSHGLWVGEDAELGEFSENTFEDNGDVSVELSADSVSDLDDKSKYGGDYIEVRGGVVSRPGTWAALEVPYRVVDSSVVVKEELLIAPGAEIVFEEKLGLSVKEGSLRAMDDEQEIVFRGDEETAGHWLGLAFSSGTTGFLDGVTIAGAGANVGKNSEAQAAAVLLESGSQLTLLNSTIRDSDGWAVYSSFNGAEINEWSNIYLDNASGAIMLDGSESWDDSWSDYEEYYEDDSAWNDNDWSDSDEHYEDDSDWNDSDWNDSDWNDSDWSDSDKDDSDWNDSNWSDSDDDNDWDNSDDDNDWNDSDDDESDWNDDDDDDSDYDDDSNNRNRSWN